MKSINKKNYVLIFFTVLFRIVFTFAVIASILFIFSNSAEIAQVSGQKSSIVTSYVNEMLSHSPKPIKLTQFQVRKLAHITEFCVLGFFLVLCLRAYTKRLIAFCAWPLLMGLCIAVADEFIQSFVPGRSSQVVDIFIDFIGVSAGTCSAIFLLLILRFIFWVFFGHRRRKKVKAYYENYEEDDE